MLSLFSEFHVQKGNREVQGGMGWAAVDVLIGAAIVGSATCGFGEF